MGKSILGILAVIVLQIAFVTYLTLDAPADATVGAIDTNAGAARLDLNILNDLDYSAPSTGPAAAAIASLPSARNTKAKPVAVADLRKIRRPASHYQRLSARPVSHRPRAQYALNSVTVPYVRRQFFGRWVVETTYGISGHQAKNISKSKKRPHFA